MLTQARLKELLSYDPLTGEFIRIKRTVRKKVGEVAGRPHSMGYVSSTVDGEELLHHRLAWLYVHGCFPPADIDHKNGVRSDNRLENLRLADRSENMQNKRMQCNNTSGLTGATWRANRKQWIAQIVVRGVHRHLGSFKTAELAHIAYLEAKSKLHTFQPVPRCLTSKLD